VENEKQNDSSIYLEKIKDSVWLAEEQMRLASERTFLSWIRTGLTSVGLGIAIAKFLVFQGSMNKYTGRWAGVFLIMWGIGIFFFALSGYKKSYQKLQIFKSDRHPLRPLIIITLVLVLITLMLLFPILE